MTARSQITLDPELQRRVQIKAAELGISFAEYVRRAVALELGERKNKGDISAIFNLVQGGPVTNIARDKDKMIGDAIQEEHRGKTDRTPARKTGRRGCT